MKKLIRKLYGGANGTLLCTLPKEVIVALQLTSSDLVNITILNEKEFKVTKIDI